MKFSFARFALLSVTLILVLSRCGDSVTGSNGVVAVSLNPPSATLRVGATVQLAASVTVGGAPSTSEAITFSSDNQSVVSVTPQGLVRALSIGTATITARTTSGASISGVVTVIAGLPFSLTKSAGDNQTASAGAAISIPPAVTVRDSAGNLLSGIAVTFTVASGGGAVSGGAATTNASGVATVASWTLGGAGPNTLTATVAGVPSVTFAATAAPLVPASLSINAGDAQSAISGNAVAIAPSVIVRAAGGQPAPNVSVTFAVTSGGGSVTGATQVTNAAGIATVGSWVLGVATANTLTASVANLAPVTFSATATQPSIALSSNPATLTLLVGSANAATQTIDVTNGGTGTLNGLALGAIVYGGAAGGWLTATLSGAGAPATISLSALAPSLTAGVYTATIPVTATASSATPVDLMVTLTIAPVATPRVVVTTQPIASVSGLPFPTQPVVTVVDAAGAVMTSFQGPVSASLASGNGTLAGTTTVTAVNGVATFTDLKITGSGQFILSFVSSVPLAAGAYSQAFSVAALPASQLVIGTQPSGAVNGSVFATQPVIELRDANGTLVTNSSAPVTVSLGAGSTGGGTLTGTTTVAAVNGVVRFTNLRISAVGTYTLDFASAALPTVTSTQLSVTLAPPVALAITTQPAGAVTGSVLTAQPVIEVRDANGARVSGATNTVTATIAGGSAGSLSGTTTVTAVNGTATFTDLVITGAGASSIVFSSTGLTPATSAAVAVSALPPTQLAVTTQPVGGATGAVLTTQPVVAVRDVNNGTVAGASNAVTVALVGVGGTLSGTTTVNAVNGVATFTNLVVTGVGSYTLNFTATGLTSATSSALTISALPPVALAVTTQPVGAVSGSVLATQPVVQVRDANAAVVAGATNVVTATLVGGGGTLSGTTTVAAVNGVATFTDLVVTGAGSYTITFASPSLTSATSASFTITPLPPTQLAIGTQPIGGATGAVLPTQPVVQVRDASNGIVAGATNAVTVTLGGSGGTLSGTTTVNAVNGVATFTDLVVTGTGTYTLAFSATGLTSTTSSAITITALPPTSLFVASQPTGAVSGSVLAAQPVVHVRDAAAGVVGGATNAVTATLVGSGGTLSGTTTVNAVNGIATFTNLVVSGAGSYTIAFSSSGLTSATSASFTITPLPPTQLAIGTQPVGGATGAALPTQPIVQVKDASNATVVGAVNSVTATLVGGGGTLTGTTTVNAVNGVATFTNLVISGPGTYTLSFTATGLTAVTSASITITALPPTALAITTQPTGATTGNTLATQPVVEVRDAGGVAVAGATNAVTASLVGSGGTLSGTTTVNAVNGVATFSGLVVTGAGSYTINFSATGLTSATSTSIVIAPLAATQLAVAAQPVGGNTGAALPTQPIVHVRDASNGTVSGASNAVTATLVGGGGTLTGTTTVNAVNGIAAFTNLVVTGAGTYTLSFTATGLTSATSASFTVSVLPPTALVVATQPSGAASGSVLTTQPVVEVRDAGNGLVGNATNAVTATLVGSGGTLSGTTTVSAVNGVATFTNLAVTGAGSYTITFTATSLTSASSASFVITPPPPTQLTVLTQPVGAASTAVLGTQPVVQIKDASNTVVAGATNAVTATLVGGGGTLSGTVTVNAVNGVATFTNLKVTGAGNYTLTFSATGLTSATSASFTITAVPTTGITLALGTAASVNAVSGTNLVVPIVADMSNAAGQNLASLTFTVTWDPTKFDYVGRTNGTFGLSPAFTVNQTAVATGVLSVSIFETDGFSTGAPTIFTVTLLPKASATNTPVTASVSAAGSDIGNAIPNTFFTIRPVAVTIP